jgi:hypothetical protein
LAIALVLGWYVLLYFPGNLIVRSSEYGIGWGGRIRTSACKDQNLVPYRLATPQKIYKKVIKVKMKALCLFTLPLGYTPKKFIKKLSK